MTRKSLVGTSVLTSLLSATMVAFGSFATVSADTDGDAGSTTFNVNVHEILSVSITKPDSWATGDTGDFLRNTIGLSVTSNNGAGFTASMKSKDTTDLVNKANSAYSIHTLNGNTLKNSITSSGWGYSLGDYGKAGSTGTNEVATNNSTNSTYKPMSTNATTVLYSASATSSNQNIFFGAKADENTASGTYSNTVVISVVSGVIEPDNPVDPTPTDPTDPVGPANPSDDDPSDNTPTQDNTNHRTVYTTVADNNDDTTTTTTEITDTYVAPQGVTTTTTSDINEGTPLATGLAVTASVAAATGIFFFILAKRRKDDDEEDETTV